MSEHADPPRFADVAAEDAAESVRHEHDAVDRVEIAAGAPDVAPEDEHLPDEVPARAPDDFGPTISTMVTGAPHGADPTP